MIFGENGTIFVSRGSLLASDQKILSEPIKDMPMLYPKRPTDHMGNFLDCVKTRGLPKGNADAACNAHIACHAANIALSLGRKVTYDPKKHEFIGDEQANLRSALDHAVTSDDGPRAHRLAVALALGAALLELAPGDLALQQCGDKSCRRAHCRACRTGCAIHHRATRCCAGRPGASGAVEGGGP